MVRSVDPAGRRQWERLLLLVAVMLGVVTMHALVTGAGTHCADLPTMAQTMTADPHAGPAGLHAGPAGCEHGSTPASHDLLHLCLAVLAAAVVLAFVAVAYAALARRGDRPASGRPTGVVIVQPRAPPRTAVRLAQLCVLRN